MSLTFLDVYLFYMNVYSVRGAHVVISFAFYVFMFSPIVFIVLFQIVHFYAVFFDMILNFCVFVFLMFL